MLSALLRSVTFWWPCIALLSPTAAIAGECPSAASDIATDRPDVSNSSLVVPAGSFQSGNGVNTSSQRAGSGFDGPNIRLRFGVMPCLELLVDVPGYVGCLSGNGDAALHQCHPCRQMAGQRVAADLEPFGRDRRRPFVLAGSCVRVVGPLSQASFVCPAPGIDRRQRAGLEIG